MNADTFNSHSVTCPICHHTSISPLVGMLGGLFTCPNCHTHLVISKSGHYVRDPFALQQWAMGRMLRRQSHPLARIGRDICSRKRLSLVAIAGSIILLGVALVTTERVNLSERQADPAIVEPVESQDDTEPSP
ncbi:hypothetical protein [Lyngbya sp. CCY1209]|uniref:hypothetical protein n=1 Tax=Lyngbya sp. CCY1209 TaxID=2886103 RepID=UPI002D20F5D1|nr:hypothetical protein [Lyngbya sp. CCY1209]MEB3885568.1 transposase [Lyngbya sp. CCY1209]